MGLRRVVFALTSQTKAQARIISRTKSGLSASEAPEGYSHAWESDDWCSSQWCSSQWPDDSCTPTAGWYSTETHTAWMVVPSLNLAYLDLGCTPLRGPTLRAPVFGPWFTSKKKKTTYAIACGNNLTPCRFPTCGNRPSLRGCKESHRPRLLP